MTPNAAKLISPRLFSALSGNRALVDLFEDERSTGIGHIALAKEISLLVVAPATANVIAKFASGVADDFLSTFYLAVRSPGAHRPGHERGHVPPSPDPGEHPEARAAGVEFVLPEKGYLACGDEGWGRLAAPRRSSSAAWRSSQEGESLKGRTVLVTAGPTREPLDPVRFLSNRSSGKMGYALAGEARRRGARVILVSGPTALSPSLRRRSSGRSRPRRRCRARFEASFPPGRYRDHGRGGGRFPAGRGGGAEDQKGRRAAPVELAPTEDILAALGRASGRARKDRRRVRRRDGEHRRQRPRGSSGRRASTSSWPTMSRGRGSGSIAEFNQVVIIDRGGGAEIDRRSEQAGDQPGPSWTGSRTCLREKAKELQRRVEERLRFLSGPGRRVRLPARDREGDFLLEVRRRLDEPASGPAPGSADRRNARQGAGSSAPRGRKSWPCTLCPLSAGRTQAVPGEGTTTRRSCSSARPPAPTKTSRGGRSSARAGQLLTRIIAAMKFKREEVFITNVVKCRPPENRTPFRDEIETCRPYLLTQIDCIAPRVIVTLGKTATDFFVPRGRHGQPAGEFHRIRGDPGHADFPSRPMSSGMRGNKDRKRLVWQDMQKVMDLLGRK